MEHIFHAYVLSAGILITSHQSPPITSQQLEPCRVAPYVNVSASHRSTSIQSTTPTVTTTFPNAPSFSAFDPALLTAAAHQVCMFLMYNIKI